MFLVFIFGCLIFIVIAVYCSSMEGKKFLLKIKNKFLKFKCTNLLFVFIGKIYEISKMMVNESKEAGYFDKINVKTEEFLERFFTTWGTYCAKHPLTILLLGIYKINLES